MQRGEIFALLGSNGAGKTTMVNILSTLMKQDSGEVRICGFDIKRQPDHVRQSISLTGQFAALDGMLTGGKLDHDCQVTWRLQSCSNR